MTGRSLVCMVPADVVGDVEPELVVHPFKNVPSMSASTAVVTSVTYGIGALVTMSILWPFVGLENAIYIIAMSYTENSHKETN